MTSKLTLAVLFGGQSTEHEISILSATNVIEALDQTKYHVQPIYIAKNGAWYACENIKNIVTTPKQRLMIVPGEKQNAIQFCEHPSIKLSIDCVVPMLHGTRGEDGAPQGLLELINLPYVGANVLASAMCMEKHVAKCLLKQAGLPVVPWLVVSPLQCNQINYSAVSAKLGNNVFIKPVSLGSSVGITKVHNENQFKTALKAAFEYDDLVLIEQAIVGREIEVPVLGNEKPVAALPGEIITHHEFYSYTAKYLDPKGADAMTPADLSTSIVKKLQQLAVDAFKLLQCSGMARVDFFVTDNEIYINELNTIPGFTHISLYPKLWEVSGIPYAELLDNLVSLALARHQHQQTLQYDFVGHEKPSDEQSV